MTDDDSDPTKRSSRHPPRGRSSSDQKVGYGQPPFESRFKPGQSGNPKGRPKQPSHTVNVREELMEVFLRPISVKQDGKIKRVPALVAMIQQLLASSFEGNLRMAIAIYKLAASLGVLDVRPPRPDIDLTLLTTDERKIMIEAHRILAKLRLQQE